MGDGRVTIWCVVVVGGGWLAVGGWRWWLAWVAGVGVVLVVHACRAVTALHCSHSLHDPLCSQSNIFKTAHTSCLGFAGDPPSFRKIYIFEYLYNYAYFIQGYIQH